MRLAAAALFALPLLLCSPARADQNADNAAKWFYAEGVKHYDAGEYEQALDPFKKAYDLSRRPAILFNLARTETHLGHHEAALGWLRRYLEAAPGAADELAVRAEIAASERALEDQRGRERAQAEAREAQQRADEQRHQAEEEHKKAELALTEAARSRAAAHPKWPGATLLAIGGAFLLTSVVTAGIAKADADAVANGSGPFTDALQAADERGHGAAQTSVATAIIGGVVALAGGGLLIWAYKGGKR